MLRGRLPGFLGSASALASTVSLLGSLRGGGLSMAHGNNHCRAGVAHATRHADARRLGCGLGVARGRYVRADCVRAEACAAARSVGEAASHGDVTRCVGER
eukprot:CAMPEP_0179838634 /NCGR_PEP_ID=MMETSP0982-20121206/813_1 /TAXON_ID=483367 /ORGANISM="non described non described, Strain CCMP 2436" /LENGTH=100 /DNA_ID=CAMNT_0021722083 /DNA_START=2399 /DNA_END=2698 /DNA_ORIENTATION=+